VVVIRNSIGGAPRSGMGLGIANTRSRLKFLYGKDASFDFELTESNAAVARVAVPAFTVRLAEAVNA
jgi:hypothetical protein